MTTTTPRPNADLTAAYIEDRLTFIWGWNPTARKWEGATADELLNEEYPHFIVSREYPAEPPNESEELK